MSTLHISDANARSVGYHNNNAGEYMSEGKSLGRRHGQGTDTWSKGNKDTGEVQDGMFRGQDPSTFPNGAKCTGDRKDGNAA